MSIIENCRLKNIGQLTFDFYEGGCNTFLFGVMLCFSENFRSGCYSYVEIIKLEVSQFFSDIMDKNLKLNLRQNFLIERYLPWDLIVDHHSLLGVEDRNLKTEI